MKANRLKNLRTSREISQKSFAKYLGVSQQTVASWEVGRTEPSNEILKNIADYFDVSTDYLLGRDNVKQNAPLSNEQMKLLTGFNALNDESKRLILEMIGQLNIAQESLTTMV